MSGPTALLLAQADKATGMTPEAWAFMLVVWAVIIGQTGYCFWKLLTSGRQLGAHEEE
jgi:hypothetical protein